MSLPVHFCISNNFGDALVPWMVRKLTGKLPTWTPSGGGGSMILGGSTMNRAGPGTKCWGAGLASLKDEVHQHADIRSFRGPISRMIALASGAHGPEIFGDAGMILPQLYTPTGWPDTPRPARYKLGVVPHYVDAQRTKAWNRDAQDTGGVKIINVFEGIEEFIDSVCSCDRIVASSLHGLVTAHAYQVPALWIQVSDSIGGDQSKYRDHLMALGMDVYSPVDCRTKWPTVGALLAAVDALGPVPPFDTGPLWEAMPEELRQGRTG